MFDLGAFTVVVGLAVIVAILIATYQPKPHGGLPAHPGWNDPIVRNLLRMANVTENGVKGPPLWRHDPRHELREWAMRWRIGEVSTYQLRAEAERILRAHPELLDAAVDPQVKAAFDEWLNEKRNAPGADDVRD